MKTYFKKHLVSVKFYDKSSPFFKYIYKPEKRFLGFVTQKEGFYGPFNTHHTFDYYKNSKSEFVDAFNEVWVKPRVVLTFVNEEQIIWFYDTYEEAQNVGNKILTMEEEGTIRD